MSQHALIIDDNIGNINVLSLLLKQEGLSYTRIDNPKTVLSTLQGIEHVDVVFLDLEMPNLDGYQVVNQLLETGRFDNTPIIAYTVHVSEIRAAHDGGFTGFIGKPLDPQRFPDQLKRILNGEQVWETL